jgi:hypothetical protein
MLDVDLPLVRRDGSVELVRRAETLEDHFATLDFKPNVLSLPTR